ncbi:MAG TPA: hypothetical protein VMM80_12260, partial [Bacteroidota bacterium]|nr:hypothetical protein [Bacteroidota bacterium]
MRFPRLLFGLLVTSALLIAPAARCSAVSLTRHPVTVGYCSLQGRLSAEDSAALTWLRGEPGFRTRLIDAATLSPDLPGVDIVWIHVPDSVAWIHWQNVSEKFRGLGEFYRRGGKFLLTGLAAGIPFIAGIESSAPELRSESITDDWLFDEKGFQGFRGHPVFDGLYGGGFTWDADADNVACRVGYFDGRNPREGNVIGVEKSYVTIESGNRLMIEYSGGRGKGICIGAFIRFSGPNAAAARMRLLLGNVLRYLAGGVSATRPTYWLKGEPAVRSFSVASPAIARPGLLRPPLPESGLVIRRDSPHNQFFDLAGRRTLVMGRENGGIDELWVQPFRALRDFRTGIVEGDSIAWLAGEPLSVEIRPESLRRLYSTRFGRLEETVFPSLRRGGAIVHYAWLNGARARPLIISFHTDLRWMWPYDERAIGDLNWAYDASRHALHVCDRSRDFYCLIGSGAAPRASLTGSYKGVTLRGGALLGDTSSALQVCHAAVYDIGSLPGRTLDFIVAGTDMGERAALADYRALLEDPASAYRGLADHYRSLLARSVTVETPDTTFDARWKWALIGADRFVMETPRLGTALVAGFSTTERGWDGGQRVSGRPGYAWYFGRDAVWSGLALDACGEA